MEIQITPARPSDREFARQLNHAAYRDVVTRQFGRWDEADQDLRFADKWEQGGYRIVRLARDPVGALWTTVEPHDLFINDVQVLPARQGAGIGAAVVERVIAEGDGLGLPVRLQVLRENRARALYERLGFRVYGDTELPFLMRRPRQSG